MLSAFKAQLTKRALMKDKDVPFYVKWMIDCYSFSERPGSEMLSHECKQPFLCHLARSHEDWQIKQAAQVLRLYAYFHPPEGATHTKGQRMLNRPGRCTSCVMPAVSGKDPEGESQDWIPDDYFLE